MNTAARTSPTTKPSTGQYAINILHTVSEVTLGRSNFPPSHEDGLLVLGRRDEERQDEPVARVAVGPVLPPGKCSTITFRFIN